MSGHSHWATIKHKKGAADAKKGKIFSKLARYIMIAAKQGGGDPTMNFKLQYAIDKAKAVNMPKDNIDRAIKKGMGELEGVSFEETAYEGYGHGGVAILVDILTDNKNRTAHDIRAIFERAGTSLGTTNCVAWMFERKGLLTLEPTSASSDDVLAEALEAGAEDMQKAEEAYEIITTPADLEKVKAHMSKKFKIQACEMTRIPKNYIKIGDEDARKLINFMETLEDHDDVQNIYTNAEFPETLPEK